MGKVLDFEKKQEQVLYNKLTSLVAKNRREIEENPWPLINKQQDEIIKYHRAVDEIRRILHPIQVHLETSYPIQPIDIRGEALEKVIKIEELVYKLGL